LLLPALNKARNKAKEIQCLNNERTIFSAIVSYSDNFDAWLPVGYRQGSESVTYRVLTRILMSNNYLPIDSSKKSGALCCPGETEPPVIYGQYSFNQRLFGYPESTSVGGPMHKITQVRKPSCMVGIVDGDATVSDYYTEIVIYTYRKNLRVGYYRHSMKTNLAYMDGHAKAKTQNEVSSGPEVYKGTYWIYPERIQ
jgi:prepilin-type processing-associated H-X9-DG protein